MPIQKASKEATQKHQYRSLLPTEQHHPTISKVEVIIRMLEEQDAHHSRAILSVRDHNEFTPVIRALDSSDFYGDLQKEGHLYFAPPQDLPIYQNLYKQKVREIKEQVNTRNR